MARTDPAINLRIPAELKARVEESARLAGRSTNAEIVFQLQTSLTRDPSKEAKRAYVIDELRKAAREVFEYGLKQNRDESDESWLVSQLMDLDHWNDALSDLERDE